MQSHLLKRDQRWTCATRVQAFRAAFMAFGLQASSTLYGSAVVLTQVVKSLSESGLLYTSKPADLGCAWSGVSRCVLSTSPLWIHRCLYLMFQREQTWSLFSLSGLTFWLWCGKLTLIFYQIKIKSNLAEDSAVHISVNNPSNQNLHHACKQIGWNRTVILLFSSLWSTDMMLQMCSTMLTGGRTTDRKGGFQLHEQLPAILIL